MSAARPSGESGKTMPDGAAAGGKQVLLCKTFAYLVLPVCSNGHVRQEGIGADKSAFWLLLAQQK